MSRRQRLGMIVVAGGLLLAGGGELLRHELAASPPDDLPEARIRLDVNTADWPELSLAPGLGPMLSQAIVARRDADGPFASLDELRAVDGIGAIRLEQLRPYLFVGPDGGAAGDASEGGR